MSFRNTFYAAAVFAAAGLFVGSACSAQAIRTVYSSNWGLPSTSAQFSTYWGGLINDAGDVLFTVEGRVGSAPLYGGWLSRGQGPETLALSNDPALGPVGGAYPIGLADSGKAAVGFNLVAGGRRNVILGTPESRVHLHSSLSPPLAPGAHARLSDSGVFTAAWGEGFQSDRNGALEIILDEEVVADVGGGVVAPVTRNGSFAFATDDSGKVLFLGGAAAVAGSDSFFGLFMEAESGLRALARRGYDTPIAGLSPFAGFGDLNMNGEGFAVFTARHLAVGPTSSSLWATTAAGELRLVAQANDGLSVPGQTNFAPFTFMPPSLPEFPTVAQQKQIVINEEGRVAFRAQAASIGYGVWSEGRTGELELVAYDGMSVSGANGLQFAGLKGFQSLAMNEEGRLAISARLTGEDQSAILVTSAEAGVLTAVVKSGDVIPVLDQSGAITNKTIATVTNGGKEFLNNKGQILFYATFDDGASGLFVVSIPEPSTSVLALLAIALNTRWRRWRAGNSSDRCFAA